MIKAIIHFLHISVYVINGRVRWRTSTTQAGTCSSTKITLQSTSEQIQPSAQCTSTPSGKFFRWFCNEVLAWKLTQEVALTSNLVKNNECDVTYVLKYRAVPRRCSKCAIALSKRWKSSCLSIKLSLFLSEFWVQNHSIVFIHFYCVYLRLKPWNLMKRFKYFRRRSKVCFSEMIGN
jgi:hypothetical protein